MIFFTHFVNSQHNHVTVYMLATQTTYACHFIGDGHHHQQCVGRLGGKYGVGKPRTLGISSPGLEKCSFQVSQIFHNFYIFSCLQKVKLPSIAKTSHQI